MCFSPIFQCAGFNGRQAHGSDIVQNAFFFLMMEKVIIRERGLFPFGVSA